MERPFTSKERICRLCLGTLGFFVNIFDNQMEIDSLASKIIYCAAIEVREADGLPDSVCHRCVAKVESACEFRLLCETSDAKLRRLLLPKITDKNACCGVEKEQKQASDCNTGETTPNAASADERAILFASSQYVTAPVQNTTKVSDSSEPKRRLPTDNFESHRCSRSTVNYYPSQSNPPEDTSLSQMCPTSVLQDCIGLENTKENSDQEHYSADSNSGFVKHSNLQMVCVSEQQQDVCHSSTTTPCVDLIENGLKTKHTKLQEEETRIFIIINEVPPLAKEPLLGAATSRLEASDSSDKTYNNPTSETGPCVVLDSLNHDIFTESSPSANNLFPQNACLTNSETKDVVDEISSAQSDSLLPSKILHGDPNNVTLHNQAEDMSNLDNSSYPPLHGEAISVDELGVSRCQPDIKTRLKIRRQPRHSSTENAAAALLMLSKSSDNKSLPLSKQECDTVAPVNVPDEANECLTISPSEVDKVLHRKDKFGENNFGYKDSKRSLKKCVTGKHSVNDDTNSHFNISSSTSEITTNVASYDSHTFTVSGEARDSNNIKEGNSYTRKEDIENISELTKVSSLEQRNVSQPQSRSDIHSGEKNISAGLDRNSQSLMKLCTTQLKRSDIQENKLLPLKEAKLYAKSNTDCSSVINRHNLGKDIKKDLSQTAGIAVESSYENIVLNAEGHTNACLMANEYSAKTKLIKETEKSVKTAEHTEDEPHIYHPDTESINLGTLHSFNKNKKNCNVAVERKSEYFAHHAMLVDHQNAMENNAKVAYLEMNNVKSSLLNTDNSNESISVSNCNVTSCDVPATISVCSGEVNSTENKCKIGVGDSKSNCSKHESENELNDILSKNLVTSEFKHSVSATSSTGKVEQPLKELRISLVRLETGARGHYLNSSKTDSIISCKPPSRSSLRQFSTLSSYQHTSSTPERNTKRRTSLVRSCALNQNYLEWFDSLDSFESSSTKVSSKKRRRAKYKGARKKAKQDISQWQDTAQISSIPSANDALDDYISKSSDTNVPNVKPRRYRTPKLSQNTRKKVSEEFGDSNVVPDGSNREDTKWDSNAVAESSKIDSNINCTEPFLRPKSIECDKTEGTETSSQHCSKPTKGNSSTSSHSLDSNEKTPKYRFRECVFHNSNDQIDVSNDYQKASNHTVTNENTSFTKKFAVSKKHRKPSLATINKKSRNETSSTGLKICYAPTTVSKVVDFPISDTSVNTHCRASSVKEINKDTQNSTSKSICGKSSRTSRTLTIESYRKLRQAKLHKLNPSINEPDNFNAEAFHSQKVIDKFASATPLNTKSSASPRHGNVYKTQREVSVNKSLSPQTYHDTNSVLKQNDSTKGQWTAQHFLGKLYIRKKKEVTPLNEKPKTSHCRSLGPKDNHDICQQILKSVNRAAEGYKPANEIRESSTNILNSIRATHPHDGDDEQCKIIRQEILKSAYMAPQLAVLTAVSPLQSPSFRDEAKYPEPESPLATVTASCDENVPSSDALHNSEPQFQHIQNKNDEVPGDDKSYSETSYEMCHSHLKKTCQPSKCITENNNPIVTEKLSIELLEDNSSLKEPSSRETPERTTVDDIPLSYAMEDNLDETNDLVLQKLSNNGINSKGAIPLPLSRMDNETNSMHTDAQQKDNSESCCVDVTPALTTTAQSCNYAKECVGIESDVADSTAIKASTRHAYLSNNRNDPKSFYSCSSSAPGHNSSFGSSLPPRHITGKVVTFVGNSTEIKHKEWEQKMQPNKYVVMEILEDNSGIKTSEQTDSITKKQNSSLNDDIYVESTYMRSDRQQGYLDSLWNERNASTDVTLHLQERIQQKNKETSQILPNIEPNNSTTRSLSGEKSQTIHSAFCAEVVSEEVPGAIGEDFAVLNSDTENTASVPVSTNGVHCEPSDRKISSCSGSSILAVHSQGHSPSASITNYEFTQLPHERRISAVEERNNENQAPTRVCYTANFIRKDLANGDIFPKLEAKTLQSKVTFSLGRSTKTSRRSKSQENYANSKTDTKFQINALRSKSEGIPDKFCGGNTLKEVSNRQGVNNKTVIPISVTKIVNSRFIHQTIRKYSLDGKKNPEMHLDFEQARTSGGVNLNGDKEMPTEKSFDFNDLNDNRKVTGSSQCRNVGPPASTTSQKVQHCSKMEASSFIDTKDKSEKPISYELVSEARTQRTDKHLLNNKTGINVSKSMRSNMTLQKKRIAGANAFICDICSKCFNSEYFLAAHQRMHEMSHRRSNTNKNNGVLRDQLRSRETYRVCSKSTNKPIRQRWRSTPDNNGRFRSMGNFRQSFHRKAGFRNSGNGAMTRSRWKERSPAWKSRRCKTCGKWFTNYFQFSHHFKNNCR